MDKSYDRCIQQGLLYAPIVGFSVGISTFRDLVNKMGVSSIALDWGLSYFLQSQSGTKLSRLVSPEKKSFHQNG